MAPSLLAWVIKKDAINKTELLEEKQAKAETREQCLGHGELCAVTEPTGSEPRSGSG